MSKLSFKQKILVAGTLFGMFFGAGNLIFPVHLGQLAGKNVIPAMIGFIITAVGIPILGVAAIGNTHSDGLQTLAGKVGKKYSIVFTCILYLTIGPFFAIPRCASTSFTVGVLPLIGENLSPSITQLIFSYFFFLAVLIFALKPGKITVWIGKIINPVFLVFLAILIISAIINPGASAFSVEPEASYATAGGSFFSSIIEGYGTMDAIAGLAFGIIVIDIIRGMGIKDDSSIAKDVLSSGTLTGILMAVIYVLTILIGTQSRGLFETSANGGIAFAQIAKHYLGNAGSIILAITITFACLKTALGLVTSCSEAFARMCNNKIPYKVWAITLSAFSFLVSNFGLDTIIQYSLPVLMLIYPPTITLIILALCGKLFDHDRAVYVSVTAFSIGAAFFDFLKALPSEIVTACNIDVITGFIGKVLPFYNLNLGWVVPSVTGLVIGLIIRTVRIKKDSKA